MSNRKSINFSEVPIVSFEKNTPLKWSDEPGRFGLVNGKMYDLFLKSRCLNVTSVVYDRSWPLEESVLIKSAEKKGISPEALRMEWEDSKNKSIVSGKWFHENFYKSVDLFFGGNPESVNFFMGGKFAALCLKLFEEFGNRVVSFGGSSFFPRFCYVECGGAGGGKYVSIYGKADLVFDYGDGTAVVVDLKTSKKDMSESGFWTKNMKEPFGNYLDIKSNHAKIQLGMYCSILKKYGFGKILPYVVEVDSSNFKVEGDSCDSDFIFFKITPLFFGRSEKEIFENIWNYDWRTSSTPTGKADFEFVVSHFLSATNFFKDSETVERALNVFGKLDLEGEELERFLNRLKCLNFFCESMLGMYS